MAASKGRPPDAASIIAQAVALQRRGRLAEALKAYAAASVLEPTNPDVFNNMGVALRSLGKPDAAAALYRRSLALRPDAPGTHSNLGNALRDMGRHREAADRLRHAVGLAPDSVEAIYNLGLALRDLGEDAEALEHFDRALALDPDHGECRWDRAFSLLISGDLERGFPESESRWLLRRSPPRTFTQPLWDGAPLNGRTIFLHREQGFGDMIQFVRYAPLVKALGGTVLVETQPELLRLFATAPGIDRLVPSNGPLPDFDVYAPLMSLPGILGTTLDTIPADVPYLEPPWPRDFRLPALPGAPLTVGITWAGKPSHGNDRNRSLPFGHMAELLSVPNVVLFNLQKGERVADIEAHGCQGLIPDLGARFSNFGDAQAVAQLDLIITADTALAHLAGALARPVWLVLPFVCDWRWMRHRDDSPWYPTMHLFRQTAHGDWDGVMDRVTEALVEESRKRSSASRTN